MAPGTKARAGLIVQIVATVLSAVIGVGTVHAMFIMPRVMEQVERRIEKRIAAHEHDHHRDDVTYREMRTLLEGLSKENAARWSEVSKRLDRIDARLDTR